MYKTQYGIDRQRDRCIKLCVTEIDRCIKLNVKEMVRWTGV